MGLGYLFSFSLFSFSFILVFEGKRDKGWRLYYIAPCFCNPGAVICPACASLGILSYVLSFFNRISRDRD
ncbi:hypothetical protein HOY80DRAFT_965710 [Tuber brumale]|nr:hypothetical protein HOY80DRAFT_965710 [Tuber brumale]